MCFVAIFTNVPAAPGTEFRPVNEMLRQIGRTDTGREGEYRKVVHARSKTVRGGREGWKEGKRGSTWRGDASSVLWREKRLFCSRTLLSATPVWPWKTVTVAQRCGFTRYFSGSSSFVVPVSLTEIFLEID